MQEVKLHQNNLKSQIKQGRAYFSKIGLLYFGGTLILYAVQWICVLLVSAAKPEWLQGTTAALLASMLPMYLLAMPLMILLVTRMKAQKPVKTYKLSAGKMILAFFMCYAILYVSNLAGTVLTTVIGLLKGSPVQNVLDNMVLSGNKWVLFIFAVLIAPFYEEFIFRKLLIDRAVKYGEGVAVVLSGLLFGLFHGNISQFAYAFFLGMFFGFIYVKTRRLRYTVILHMAVNFMGSIAASWLMEATGMQKVQKELQMVLTNPESVARAFENAMPGMLIMMGYSVVLMGIVITGVILLLFHRDKFKLSPGELTIPKGKRFATFIVNLGMLLFIGFWIIQIVRQLFM